MNDVGTITGKIFNGEYKSIDDIKVKMIVKIICQLSLIKYFPPSNFLQLKFGLIVHAGH